MNGWQVTLLMAGIIISACSGSDRKVDENAGTLDLALTGSDSQGEIYRLRSATFTIEGYPDYYYPSSSAGAGGSDSSYYYETVSTEANPNQDVIRRRVIPGYYYVSFDTSSGWYLEHLTPQGPERVAEAVLLSQPYQYTHVWDRSTSTVFYQFGVDGKTIDFRHGNLEVRIDIQHPDAGSGGVGGEPGFGGSAGLEASGGAAF